MSPKSIFPGERLFGQNDQENDPSLFSNFCVYAPPVVKESEQSSGGVPGSSHDALRVKECALALSDTHSLRAAARIIRLGRTSQDRARTTRYVTSH